MTVKTLRRQLAAAIAMTLVSTVALGSSTYAWFTMNKDVSVTGMQLQTKVSGNLLICQTNNEANFSSTQLSQVRSALLEPVSTVNAATDKFFYTLDAAADGQKITAATTDPYVLYDEASGTTITGADKIDDNGYASSGAAKAKVDTAFNAAYGITATANAAVNTNAYGYVDYDFYLKAISDAANQSINVTWCNMLYNANESGSDAVLGDNNDAWRVAIFAKDITSDRTDGTLYSTDLTTYTSGTESTNLKAILAPDGATYFTAGKAVSVANAAPSVNVSKLSSSAVIDTFGSTIGETRYYKVTVRVWLEGEDNTCYSANYSTVEVLYKLDLGFELGKGTAVTKIGSSTTAWSPVVVTP
jgi:hypothetical protein